MWRRPKLTACHYGSVQQREPTQRGGASYFSPPSPNIQERVLAALTSGWGVTGVYTAHSGLPFNPTENVQRSRSGVGGGAAGVDRPDLNPAFSGPVVTGPQWVLTSSGSSILR